MTVTNVSARPVGHNGGVSFGFWNLNRTSLVVGAVALVALGVLAVVFVMKRLWVRNAEPQPRLPAPPPPPITVQPTQPSSPLPVSPPADSTPQPTASTPTASTPPLSTPQPSSVSDQKTPVTPVSTPTVSSLPSISDQPVTSKLTKAQVIEQYKARINDIMTLSGWDLRPGSKFDKQIDALEISAEPVVLLTGLVYTFRTDEQTKQHLETLLKPCAMTSLFGFPVPDVTDAPRVTKKALFISKFVERTKRLFTPESTLLRQTAIRELGLDETTVNTMYQAIEEASSSTQSIEGEKFFRYFLTGKLPGAADAAATAADDQKT